jgi:hypothetical protein
MGYEVIDSVLIWWAAGKSLPLYKQYRDDEVRSMDVVGRVSARAYQLWVDRPDTLGKTVVHAWDRKDWRVRYETTAHGLAEALDRALKDIERNDAGPR